MSEVKVIENVSFTIDKDGEHDKFAHYVEQDQFMEAIVHGLPAIALCGKIWVPTREGASFPVCKTCEEVYSQLI